MVKLAIPSTERSEPGVEVPMPTLLVEKSYTKPEVSIASPPAKVEVELVPPTMSCWSMVVVPAMAAVEEAERAPAMFKLEVKVEEAVAMRPERVERPPTARVPEADMAPSAVMVVVAVFPTERMPPTVTLSKSEAPDTSNRKPVLVVALAPTTTTSEVSIGYRTRLSLVVAQKPEPPPPLWRSASQIGTPPESLSTCPSLPAFKPMSELGASA